jgi:type I restriction enzyme S subunit
LNPRNQFARKIQQKQQAETNLQKSESLFNSLLQRAFKGELTSSEAA